MRGAVFLLGIAGLAACAHVPARPAAPPDRVAMREFPARDQTEQGLLRGTVRDGDGPMVGATLVVEGTDRIGLTEDDGSFRIAAVPPGPHKVVVYWNDEAHDLGVRAFGAGVTQLYATLAVKPDSGIIVERCEDWGGCDPPMIDTTSTQLGLTIEHDGLTNLP